MKTTKLQAMNNKAQLLAAKVSVAEAYTQVLQAKADVQKAKAELLKQQATLAQAKYAEALLKHNISEAKATASAPPVEACEAFNVEEATLVEPVPSETIVELPDSLPEPVIVVEEPIVIEDSVITTEEHVIAEHPVIVESIPEFIEVMKTILLPLRKQGLASDEWDEYERMLKELNDVKKQGAIVQQQWLDKRNAATLAKRKEYDEQFKDAEEPAWLLALGNTPSTESVLSQLEAIAATTVNITSILPDEEEFLSDEEWAAADATSQPILFKEVMSTEDDCGY